MKPAEALKKGEPEGSTYDYEEKIDFAVFPSLQGGPHNHQIAALAVALKYAQTAEFKVYQKQVKANARAFAAALMKKGYKIITGGTDNHLMLWDLRPEVCALQPCLIPCEAILHLRLIVDRKARFSCRILFDKAMGLVQGITGSKMEKACDLCHITLNKNAVVGDVSAMTPGGVRIGAPAMTSRGLMEKDFEAIADLMERVLHTCKAVQTKYGKLLKDFNR